MQLPNQADRAQPALSAEDIEAVLPPRKDGQPWDAAAIGELEAASARLAAQVAPARLSLLEDRIRASAPARSDASERPSERASLGDESSAGPCRRTGPEGVARPDGSGPMHQPDG